jgi:Spy/CpxP family protein refolding chaperone
MRRRILFLFLGLTLAGVSLAWGQPGREFGGGGGFQDKFLEVKRNQLGPVLGVNQQTVDQLLAIDARYKPLRHQLTTGMRSDMQRLQQLMSQPSPPEQEIKPLLAEMKRKRLEMLNLQQRKDDEETALLTPMQQARYLMYLMSLIKEARNVKSGTGGPGGQGRPGVVGGPGGMGTPGGMAVPTLRPTEIPVSRPTQ